jgi:hypothetical protein
LCPVRRPLTALDCVLLKDSNWAFVARLGPEINSRACLCVLEDHATLPDAGYPPFTGLTCALNIMDIISTILELCAPFPDILIYLLTPWSRVLLEKLTGLQLVKKFSAFYETRRFITAFTRARHLSLS